MMEHCDRFVELPLRATGVYALALRGEIVYVGKSTNVLARVSQHRVRMQRKNLGKPDYLRTDKGMFIVFDRAFVRWAPEDELDKLEIEMIEKYKPTLNVRLRRNYKSWVDFKNLSKRMETWKSHSNEFSRGFVRRF